MQAAAKLGEECDVARSVLGCDRALEHIGCAQEHALTLGFVQLEEIADVALDVFDVEPGKNLTLE